MSPTSLLRAGLLAAAILATSLAAPARAGVPWLVQLQNLNPTNLTKSGFSRMIIDYSREGDDASAFSAATVAGFKRSAAIVLSYLSTGEAEDYRFYFQPAWKNSGSRPAWLGSDNPNWPGNYKVRYWDPQWRETVLRPYLQRIVRAGFSGVFLDVVDAFEYWGDADTYQSTERRRAGDPTNVADAARRMIDLIVWIKSVGTSLRGSGAEAFQVYPNNAERLIGFDYPDGRFLRTISGLVVESLWYGTTSRLPAQSANYRLPGLRQARNAGKKVVIIEYVDTGRGMTGTNATRINQFLSLVNAERFDYYIARTNQALNNVNIIPGVQP